MLTTKTPEIKLPEIRLGQTHNFTYIIKNESDEPIFPDISLGCGSCTSASFTTTPIKPKSETALFVAFTPKQPGDQQKSISINYAPKGLNAQLLRLTFRSVVI